MKSCMNYLWTEKYRPSLFTDFYFNQNKHLNALKWLNTWKRGSNFLVLTGGPGIGKTSLAYCISRMLGYHIVEYNASDDRSNELVKTIVLNSKSLTLGNKKKIILIDEIDNISKDYIFLKDLMSKKSNIHCPLIFCCNEFYETPLRTFKGFLDIVKLSLNLSFIKETIEAIIMKENILIDDIAVSALLETGNNDLRSIINNLQLLSLKKKSPITPKKIRDFKTINNGAFKVAHDIFGSNIKYENKNKGYYQYINSLYRDSMEKLFLIVFENYPTFCRMFNYFPRISEANYFYDSFPDEYKFIYIDAYNDLCRSREKIELQYHKIDFEDKSFVNIYKKTESIIQFKNEVKEHSCGYNKKLQYEIYPYIYEFISSKLEDKNENVIRHLKEIEIYYPNVFCIFDSIFSEYMKFLRNFTTSSLKFEVKKEFKFKYKEGCSSSGRMYIGINDIFK